MTTTKSELQPIDLSTIREGMPVVIRQKGSEWDKAKGSIITWDATEGYVLVVFGPKDRGIRFPASIVYHVPATEPQPALQKVDVAKLKPGDKVQLYFPQKVRDAETMVESRVHHNETVVFSRIDKQWVRYYLKNENFERYVSPKYCYYPPATEPQAPQPEQVTAWQPVLIELDKAVNFIDYDGYYLAARSLESWGKQNQHHPSQPEEQQASPVQQAESEEWVPEVGDTISTSNGGKGVIGLINDDESRMRIDYEGGWIGWHKKGNLTLVKKADTMQQSTMRPDSETLELVKPFTLLQAREMHRQGGMAADVAKEWYSVEELERKELPMSWDELPEPLNGFYIIGDEINDIEGGTATNGNENTYPTRLDAEAALATAQLLQLRKAWLEIEAPGWGPNWTNASENKWIIRRNKDLLNVTDYQTAWQQYSFPTEDLATRFLAAFRPLLLTAFCLPADNQEGGGE